MQLGNSQFVRQATIAQIQRSHDKEFHKQKSRDSTVSEARKVSCSATVTEHALARNNGVYAAEQRQPMLGYKSDFFKQYNLGNVIGKGKYGTVYQATSTAGVEQAVKVIPKRGQDDSNPLLQIHKEVQIMQKLKGVQRVAQIIDAFEDQNYVYIVQDLIKGENLHNVILKGSLPPKNIPAIFANIMSTVATLHAQGYVIADLKPANFVFNSQDEECQQLTLVDLGTCRMLRPWETQFHQQSGTIPFFAPEVFDRTQSMKSDVWALGCILYQMITATLPCTHSLDVIDELTFDQLRDRVVSCTIDYNSPNFDNKSLEHAEDILRQLLQSSPDARPDLSDALKHPFFHDVDITHVDGPRPVQVFDVEQRQEYLAQERGTVIALVGSRRRSGRSWGRNAFA